MFEKSLNELIRGVRAHPDTEAKYISQSMDECRKELRLESMDTKANAISKLCYMHMLGYDIGWAAFHIVEVMSSKKFTHKRIGYLAAAQSFSPETDVLMLTTNMIKKDLGAQNQYEIGTAIGGLSQFATPDLARDLAHDIVVLTTSTRPYVRKMATLVLYKIFLRFPDALRPAFPRLKEKLDDAEPSVQSCAVNVICELARKNPKNYIALAQIFFKLLTTSQNNWMRIKIIKLFAALTPLEPRLAKKLIDPLTNLIHQTPAMSLLYECIITVIISVPDHLPSIQLCVTKLRIFIEDADQNLKYLGLQAMAEILKIHPKAVAVHKDLIISCLDDGDESIRVRALALIGGMCSKKNLQEIVLKLLQHLEAADGHSYRDEVVSKVIDICYQGNYQYVTDFTWYLSVLVQLTKVESSKHGKLIGSQMMDVAIRVAVVREFAVEKLSDLLNPTSHLMNSKFEKNGPCEVLYACAYVCGEFAKFIANPGTIIEALLNDEVVNLPGHVQGVFLHNVLKVYAFMSTKVETDDEDAQTALGELRELICDKLSMFTISGDLEVQERAVGAMAIISYVTKQRTKGLNIDAEVAQLFEGDLNPVAPKAQKKVPVPEGLNLDKWINAPPKKKKDKKNKKGGDDDMFDWMNTTVVDDNMFEAKPAALAPEVVNKQRERRLDSQAANPFHLGGASKKNSLVVMDDVDSIPVVTLDEDIGPITVESNNTDGKMDLAALSKGGKKKKLTKKEKKRLLKKGLPIPDEDKETPAHAKAVVTTGFDMPEGMEDTDEEDNRADDDVHKALDINLEDPLDDNEVLPQGTHHVAKGMSAEEAAKLEQKKKKEEKKAKKAQKKGKKEKKEKKEKKKKDGSDDEESKEKKAESSDEEEKAEDPLDMGPMDDGGLDNFLDEPPKKEKKEKKKDKKEKKDKKDKKEKKEKKDKKEKKASSDEPSQQQAVQFPASVYGPLGSNDVVDLSYDTMVSAATNNQVQISMWIKNKGDSKLTALELTLEDTDSLKVSRPDIGLSIPFDVDSGSVGDYRVILTIDKIGTAHTMEASIAYKVGDSEEVASLDFKLHLPVATFTFPGACDAETFGALLGGASLTAKESLSAGTKGAPFEAVVASVCSTLHLSVVEMMDKATSLYGVNTDGSHFCFLLKMKADENTFSLDGKSNDGDYLSSILAEIKTTLE